MENRAFLLIVSLIMTLSINAQLTSFDGDQGDFARIFKAMNKGRNGENIKVGAIGGSITQGYAASSESKRWCNLVADWWEEKFPGSTVELINAGWGGTGSDIGAHRAFDDLLVEQPDFFVIEFAVNDVEGDLALKMMEGLIQQSLVEENNPGVMILTLKQDNGTTAQASHKPVAEHYGVPLVSFADLIDAQVDADGISLSSIFVDGLHPNDVGMAYIADFIKAGLDSIYALLPVEAELPEINTELPVPLVGDVYSNTFQYFPDNIVPLQNLGWEEADKGWDAETVDSQIDFQVTGNAVSVIFTQNNASNRGRAEVWVDEGDKTIIDAYMTDDWGTKYAYALVQEGLADGEHILHIKVISESSTGGNYVNIERVMVAGNVGSAAPIAKTSSYQKGVLGVLVEMDGSESFDPDGDAIDSYEWSVVEKPNGSEITINKADEALADFMPDVAGDYIIQLSVTAGINSSVPAVKKISIRETNAKPIAVPGNDTISDLDKYFRFDGTKSSDADGDELLYSWVLESSPAGSATYLLLPETAKPQCEFDLNGDYVFSLVVFDSIDYSDKSYISVEGRDGYTNIRQIEENLDWVSVYPNPTQGRICLQYFLESSERITLSVYNLQGKQVAETIFVSNVVGVNSKEFDLGSICSTPGIYMLKLSGDSFSKTIRAYLI